MRRSYDRETQVCYLFANQELRNDRPDKLDREEKDERPDPEPMQRLYARNDDDQRRSLELVRCPLCGVMVPWPRRYKRPKCWHTRTQTTFGPRVSTWREGAHFDGGGPEVLERGDDPL